MNGPEHYREAERLLACASNQVSLNLEAIAGVLAAAQVHATLALVAATVAPRAEMVIGEPGPRTSEVWSDQGWEVTR